jgi:hypothetical protein
MSLDNAIFGYQLEIEYYVSTVLSKDIRFVRSSECIAPCLVKECAFTVFCGSLERYRIIFATGVTAPMFRVYLVRGVEVPECCVTYI